MNFLIKLLKCEPEVSVQVVLVVFWVLVVEFAMMRPFYFFIDRVTRGRQCRERGVSFQQKQNLKQFGHEVGREVATEMWLDNFTMSSEHLITTLLCLPALLIGLLGQETVFNMFSTVQPTSIAQIAYTLVRHGGLIEMGFELGHLIRILYRFFGRLTKDGKRTVHPAELFLVVLHHLCGCLVIVPMNLAYGDSLFYAELLALLTSAGAFNLLMRMYTATLDAETRQGQVKLFWESVVTSIIMFFFRGIYFGIVCWKLLTAFYKDHRIGYLGLGAFLTLLFGFLNLVIILGTVKRFFKFFTRVFGFGTAAGSGSIENENDKSTISKGKEGKVSKTKSFESASADGVHVIVEDQHQDESRSRSVAEDSFSSGVTETEDGESEKKALLVQTQRKSGSRTRKQVQHEQIAVIDVQ